MLTASFALVTIDGSIPRVDKVPASWVPNTLQSALTSIRSGLLNLTSPVYVVAQAPYQMSEALADITDDRQSLLRQRGDLQAQLLLLQQQQQRFNYLQQENMRLRQLLGSKAQLPSQVTIAEIVGVSPNPLRAELLVDKGHENGISQGQAVVDAQGVFGQVVHVAAARSWVLLITDRDHALPVRNSRTGVRMILGGTGGPEALVLEDLPASTDILAGDLIETSGLGGRFPVGYPVGVVDALGDAQDTPYLSATVKPSAALSKVGHVLIIADGGVKPMPTQDAPGLGAQINSRPEGH